jgi:hypothetical protein
VGLGGGGTQDVGVRTLAGIHDPGAARFMSAAVAACAAAESRKVQHARHDHAYRLVQVDYLADLGSGEHRGDIGQVGGGRDHAGPTSQQRAGVGDRNRVDVDVSDPRPRIDLPCRLGPAG